MIFLIPVVYRCSKIVLTSEHYYAWGGGWGGLIVRYT